MSLLYSTVLAVFKEDVSTVLTVSKEDVSNVLTVFEEFVSAIGLLYFLWQRFPCILHDFDEVLFIAANTCAKET